MTMIIIRLILLASWGAYAGMSIADHDWKWVAIAAIFILHDAVEIVGEVRKIKEKA